MEETKSKDRSILKAILVILSLNLLLTAGLCGVFVLVVISEFSKADAEATGGEPLPKGLVEREDRDQLFADFKQVYNSGDNEQLLAMYGKAYQIQLVERGFDEAVKPMRTLASSVDDGAFKRYEFEEGVSDLKMFHLYYEVRSPEGWLELKLSVVQ